MEVLAQLGTFLKSEPRQIDELLLDPELGQKYSLAAEHN